jgi:hypothetical protein
MVGLSCALVKAEVYVLRIDLDVTFGVRRRARGHSPWSCRKSRNLCIGPLTENYTEKADSYECRGWLKYYGWTLKNFYNIYSCYGRGMLIFLPSIGGQTIVATSGNDGWPSTVMQVRLT